MGRGRPKKDKDPFDALELEFRDAIVNSTVDQIKERIYKVAMDQVELNQAQKDDQHLAEAAEAHSSAAAVYREGTKVNKLKLKYCKQVLGDKGVV